ncbi:MAG: 2-C-methyl-D-erythritol 2,4-cyclodiphosphate synthase [Vampirovibrionales bacterium]
MTEQLQTLTRLRTGLGTDLHRLAEGLPLVIGGVAIPHSKGCVAHSDGDVLLHALIDALLGATALGDIGLLFPPNEVQWKQADSAELLTRALAHIRQQYPAFQVINVDMVVHAQRPKLAPCRIAICKRVADLLGLPVDRVNFKAKTGEHLAPIGTEEAIEALVSVLVLV